jgi:pentatricopeptide repeat protein
MSRIQNAVGVGGVIENYVADVAVTMVFGLGYYLFKAINKKKDSKKSESWSDPSDNLKTLKGKLEGALERWQYAKTVEEYHELIKSDYEGVQDPFAILNLMNKKGIIPTIETYNALLLNCLSTNHNEYAELLKEEMLDPMGPVAPNTYTLNVLIKGLNLKIRGLSQSSEKHSKELLHKEFDNGLIKILHSMESRSVYMDLITQNTILDSLIDQGRLNEAWNQYCSMKRCFTPDMYTFSTLLRGIKYIPDLSEDWLDKAFGILEEAKSMYELDENFLNTLLDACVKFNRIDKAEELFKDIETRGKPVLSEYTYNIMVKGYGKVFKLNKALEMFSKIKTLGEGYSPNTISYGAMLNACVRCKNINLAEELVIEMTKNKVEKNLYIYSTMINGYRKTKNGDKAIELYDYLINKIESDEKELIENGTQNNPIMLNTIFFNSVLDVCVDSNKYEKMDQIFKYFKSKSESDNKFPQIDLITYSIVMKGYAKGSYLEKVTEIYSQIRANKDLQLDEVLYNTLIDCYARSKDEENVFKIFTDMKNNGVKVGVITYGVLIKLYCNMGNCNKAFELFDECVKSDIKPSVVIYQMLIKLQVKSNFIDRAVTLFRNMVLNGVKPDAMIYELIIKSCIEHERIKEAFEFTLNATKEGLKLEKYIYDNLAEGFKGEPLEGFKSGEKAEAISLLLKTLRDNNINLDKNSTDKFQQFIPQPKSYHQQPIRMYMSKPSKVQETSIYDAPSTANSQCNSFQGLNNNNSQKFYNSNQNRQNITQRGSQYGNGNSIYSSNNNYQSQPRTSRASNVNNTEKSIYS